ncbi:MAG: hypothetical protein ACI9EF_000584 [Pseudohongiellaceae bacterium]|jgi:hypothetical protein
MKIVLLDKPQAYDGLQLATAFVDSHCPEGEGDALILFEGQADVPEEHLVDLEDAEAGDFIYSPWMAHFIIEHRGLDLRSGVLAQRLLMRLMGRWLEERSGQVIDVRGDDLYFGTRKLSVSIATTSPRGVLIHTAVNVRTENAPVPAAGLCDLRVPALDFLKAAARLYADEMASVEHATTKVRPAP